MLGVAEEPYSHLFLTWPTFGRFASAMNSPNPVLEQEKGRGVLDEDDEEEPGRSFDQDRSETLSTIDGTVWGNGIVIEDEDELLFTVACLVSISCSGKAADVVAASRAAGNGQLGPSPSILEGGSNDDRLEARDINVPFI